MVSEGIFEKCLEYLMFSFVCFFLVFVFFCNRNMTAMKISVCIFISFNRSNAKSRTMQMYLPRGTSPIEAISPWGKGLLH